MGKSNVPKNLTAQVCSCLLPKEERLLDKKAGAALKSRSAYIRQLVVEDQKHK